jgi:hypothetical protein
MYFCIYVVLNIYGKLYLSLLTVLKGEKVQGKMGHFLVFSEFCKELMQWLNGALHLNKCEYYKWANERGTKSFLKGVYTLASLLIYGMPRGN